MTLFTGKLSNSTKNKDYISDVKIMDNCTIDGGSGNLSVNGHLVINDRDILKELDEMRDALLLLKRDVNMEAKYPRLQKLKEQYEAELERYKTFDTLKESKK